MQIGRSLFSIYGPDHFVLYSLLDSEPTHEHFNIQNSLVNQNIKLIKLINSKTLFEFRRFFFKSDSNFCRISVIKRKVKSV
jgi:hypothetical protein